MADNKDLSPEEQREIARRHQQANWFMGGLLIVVGFGIGNAISVATSNRMFILIGLAVGIIGAWAVNKYVK